jgi:hypothetical protein
METERAGEEGSGRVSGRGRGRREGGTADTGDKFSMINNLIRLEALTSLPLTNFGPHLVQVKYGFQVIAREPRALLSHLVSRCGEETFRRG